ncbi:MAG: hypothetical protein AAGD86_02840, partial [Pseudomonadota bacterium]
DVAVDGVDDTTDGVGAAQDEPTAVVLAEPDVTCQRMQITGSRLYRKVCLSAAQRAALKEEVERFARDMGRARGRFSSSRRCGIGSSTTC